MCGHLSLCEHWFMFFEIRDFVHVCMFVNPVSFECMKPRESSGGLSFGTFKQEVRSHKNLWTVPKCMKLCICMKLLDDQ